MNTFKKLCIVIAAPLSLTACEQVLNNIGGPAPLATTVVDEKSLYVAEAAFKGISITISEATDSGFLKGEKAAQVQGYYRTGYAALLKARQAQKAGDNGTLLEQINFVTDAVASIYALTK